MPKPHVSAQNRLADPESPVYLSARREAPASGAPLLYNIHEVCIMSSTADEITIEYEEAGQILVKEIDKVILSKGAWTTILFRYQELIPETGEYGPDKYAIRRYQKMGGEYRQKSKFNISSAEQARKIVDALSGWLAEC